MKNCDLRSALRAYCRPHLSPKAGQSPVWMEIRTPYSGSSLKFPMVCTDGPGKICGLLKNLSAVNELLYLTAAEVVEIAPQKVAIRFFGGIMQAICGKDAGMREYATIFLDHVLTVHRCVECVEMGISPRGYRGCETLFDSLGGNMWVNCLRLSDCKLDSNATALAAVAISSLLKLQLRELSLDLVHFVLEAPTSLHGLTEGLQLSTKLKKLRIVEIYLHPEKSWAREFTGRVLDALSHMTSHLSSLVLDSTYASYKDGKKFKSMLTHPLATANLTVQHLSHRGHPQRTALVWDALAENRTITKLCLKGFTLSLKDAKSLSALLSWNSKILDVDCARCKWDTTELVADARRPKWHVRYLVYCLATTTSLRRLAVDFCFFERELLFLLMAANNCASLQELHFPHLHYESMLHWGVDIFAPEMFRKVTVGMCGPFGSLFLLRRAQVESGVIKALPGQVLNILAAPLIQWNPFLHLRGNWLTSLVLRDLEGENESEVAKALAAYLTVAPHLKRLRVMLLASASSAHEVITGLAANNTIQEVDISNFCLNEEGAEVLCRWVARSRSVYSLTLLLKKKAENMVVQKLAALLDSNYTLTRFFMDPKFFNNAEGQHVSNIVRRNYGFLQCAAHFALGNSLKRAIESFEMVSWHPRLPSEIQHIGSVDEDYARDRIHKSLHRLRDGFWSLAGIVREELVCNPPPQLEGSSMSSRQPPQLDELGCYLLAHIRSFLRIADILDDKVENDEGIDKVIESTDGDLSEKEKKSSSPLRKKPRRTKKQSTH